MLEDYLQAISQDNNGFPPLHKLGFPVRASHLYSKLLVYDKNGLIHKRKKYIKFI